VSWRIGVPAVSMAVTSSPMRLSVANWLGVAVRRLFAIPASMPLWV
jgi:hypothetical protein